MELTTLFEETTERKASDLHLASGEVPRIRVGGELVRLDVPPLEETALARLLQPYLPSDAKFRLDAGRPVEKTILYGERAFNGIVFRFGDQGLAATFRVLDKAIPSLEKIGEGAMPLFQSIVSERRGLVLIAGATGSGKWTTACSLADAINDARAGRIFVVSGQAGYQFESRRSLVTSLHVGQNCESYVRALDVALHADLDVVVVDDVPTVETVRQMLMLAETGHLVIANMPAPTVRETVQRLLDSAGADSAPLRASLAQNLVAITSQRLLPRVNRPGRVPAYEWVTATPAVRAALLAGDVEALDAAQEVEGVTLNASLDRLIGSGEVTAEVADAHRRL